MLVLKEKNTDFSEAESKRRVDKLYMAILKKYPRLSMYLGRISGDKDLVNHKIVARYIAVCKEFKLDPFDLQPLDNYFENRKENILENRMLAMYCTLNREGRERIMEMLEDVCGIEKYRIN